MELNVGVRPSQCRTVTNTRTLAALLFVSSSLFATAGCAAEATSSPDDPVASESALTSVAVGRYVLAREPSAGNYITELTISAGKKVELEWVHVTTTTEPWFFNPWVRVPVTKKEKLALQGSYDVFAGDPGETLISFNVTDRGIDHLIYSLEKTPNGIALHAIGGQRFEMKQAAGGSTRATETRILDCKGGRWDATITLDEAQRRRGTMKITRRADAQRNDPPNISFTVAYNGDTGVSDYMGYEGFDSQGNGYEFALRKSDLEKTSGPISSVGLGYTPDLAPGGWHNSLTCTIKRP
jgi:hypothetical protein